MALQYFEHDTVENFVQAILDKLYEDESRRQRFKLQGRVISDMGDSTEETSQCCVHVLNNECRMPIYAVEFKAPHKLTLPELASGLHEMELARDVIGQDGDSFEYHTTRLVAAVITQLFSYMVHSGVHYGYICTREAFVFLHVPDDLSIVQYYLCVPNCDIRKEDEYGLH